MCKKCVEQGLMTEDELDALNIFGVTTLGNTLSSALRVSDVADAMWRGVFSSMTRAGWEIGVMLNNDTDEVGIVWQSEDMTNDIIVMGVLPEPFAAALRPLVPSTATTKQD
jgi:hypothetical protein